MRALLRADSKWQWIGYQYYRIGPFILGMEYPRSYGLTLVWVRRYNAIQHRVFRLS